MNLKSRLFGKPWEDRDPDARAKAVSESDDPDLREALGRIAEHDESAEVRLAALKRINTEAFWLDARLRESNEAICQAADAFLARAIFRSTDDRLQAERLDWFGRMGDPELIRRVARQAPDGTLRRAALERITAQGFLGDCYIAETDDELAERILERIDQPSTLTRILETLRKSNKKRARCVEGRLNTLRAASGEFDAGAESARTLAESMEELSRGEFPGDRANRLQELQQRWQALDQPPATLERRFRGAEAIVRRSLEHSHREREGPKNTPGPRDLPAPDADLERAANAIRERITGGRTDGPAIGELLSAWDRAWDALSTPGEADTALRERTLPLIAELQRKIQSEKSRQAPARQPTASGEQPDFDAELDQVASDLEGGNLAAAQATLRRLRSAFDRLPRKSRPPSAGGRLHRMEGRLKEMRDWEHWSNNKIRDELIEQVEQLVDSGQHPDAITEALKQAREEWQRLESLEVLPGDKRRFAAPPGQWRRFQAACRKAFETARPFFEKRQQVQADNLAALEAFIEKGNRLAESDAAEAAEMAHFMSLARQSIRRLDDLPPKSRGKSAARLRSLMNALSSRLDALSEQAEAEKRRLINEARQLDHESDLEAAIEKAKSLQARWQQTPRARRRVEQQLWKAFREPIDPLFEKRDEKFRQKDELREAARAELTALCEQVETIAALGDEELESAETRLRALSKQWHSARGRPATLNERFERAERKYSKRLTEIRNRQRRQARAAIEEFAARIQKLWERRQAGESALQTGEPPAAVDRDLAEAMATTAERLADPDSDDKTLAEQASQNAETARQIVVEMEFLAGLDSPEEDRKLRMDYQVKRLAERMGGGSRQPDLASELAELQQRWYRSFPHPPESHATLAKRFEKCQNVIESMIGQ